MTERNTSRPFDTEAEAWAFREGAEMVNDSAITDLDVTGTGPYIVTWHDTDNQEEPQE